MIEKTINIIADDRTCFPLVVIPGLPFHVGWLPLTWIQLEYFLSETSDRRFDSAWYQDVVSRTNRVSSSVVGSSNFPNLFVRGLKLQEAQLIGRWWSEDRFFLPTVGQWMHVQQEVLAHPAIFNPFEGQIAQELHPRALRVAKIIEEVTSEAQPESARTLGDQMLLRNGLRELVTSEEGSFAMGIGTPHRMVEAFTRDLTIPLDDGNRARRPEVGMRLFLKV